MFKNRFRWESFQLMDGWALGATATIKYEDAADGSKTSTALVLEVVLLTRIVQIAFFFDEVPSDF